VTLGIPSAVCRLSSGAQVLAPVQYAAAQSKTESLASTSTKYNSEPNQLSYASSFPSLASSRAAFYAMFA